MFFDNLQETDIRGPLLEETHYYPFGLVMAGLSSRALATSPENKEKFNGIEQNTDFDLNIYDAFYRNLDPQIGRFLQVDPKLESAEPWSPYVAMLDNPIRYADPLGDSSIAPWSVRSFSPINLFSPLLSTGTKLIRNDQVRVAYNREAATLAPGDMQARVDLKEKYRAQTPEPFKTIVERGRPMSTEQAKVNDVNFKGNAAKTNIEVTEAVKTGGVIGTVVTGAGIVQSGVTIANSKSPSRETVSEAAGWSAALSGGGYGTRLGLSLSGGNPYAGLGGGIIGSTIGFFFGKNSTDAVLNSYPAMKDAIKTYNAIYPIEKPGNLIYHVR